MMDHILFHIFKIIFKYIIKKHEKVTGNHPIRIYVNKIEKLYLKLKQSIASNV